MGSREQLKMAGDESGLPDNHLNGEDEMFTRPVFLFAIGISP